MTDIIIKTKGGTPWFQAFGDGSTTQQWATCVNEEWSPFQNKVLVWVVHNGIRRRIKMEAEKIERKQI